MTDKIDELRKVASGLRGLATVMELDGRGFTHNAPEVRRAADAMDHLQVQLRLAQEGRLGAAEMRMRIAALEEMNGRLNEVATAGMRERAEAAEARLREAEGKWADVNADHRRSRYLLPHSTGRQMKTLCIYHGKCADGFTAAWAVWKALGETVEFVPGVYGEPPPDCAGRDVLMVDFSYKRAVIEGIAAAARSVLILDHHKTAREDLSGLGYIPRAYDDFTETDDASARIGVVFDMERSGAQITWDFFHRGIKRPNLVEYVGDRDLWRFALPLSREVNAYVFAHEYTFKNWDYLDAATRDHMGIQTVADMGGAIEKKHHKDVAELVSVMRRRMVIGGQSVPVANIPYTLTSDAGHLMAKGEPFAACYWDTPAGRVFSLRSTDDGADVSAVAKAYGGGGHARASGFQKPLGWEGDSQDADDIGQQEPGADR